MASIVEEMVFENKTLPPGFEVLLEQKSADLFAICDQEDKGFVTKVVQLGNFSGFWLNSISDT